MSLLSPPWIQFICIEAVFCIYDCNSIVSYYVHFMYCRWNFLFHFPPFRFDWFLLLTHPPPHDAHSIPAHLSLMPVISQPKVTSVCLHHPSSFLPIYLFFPFYLISVFWIYLYKNAPRAETMWSGSVSEKCILSRSK